MDALPPAMGVSHGFLEEAAPAASSTPHPDAACLHGADGAILEQEYWVVGERIDVPNLAGAGG